MVCDTNDKGSQRSSSIPYKSANHNHVTYVDIFAMQSLQFYVYIIYITLYILM